MDTRTYLYTASGLILSGTAAYGTWSAVGALAVLAVSWASTEWLNRLKPEQKPEPTGKELQAQLDAHREQLQKELDNIRGKMDLRPSMRLLRE